MVAILLPLIWWTHTRSEAILVPTINDFSQEAYISPDAVKMLSLGFDQIIADLYWLKFVQYVGNATARSVDNFSQAENYLDLITVLDPHFVAPYYFGAFILGSELHKPQIATQLVDRGMAANPENWCLPFIGGINQYLYAHDEVKAAHYYRLASKFPDAPKWLLRQAHILEAKIPSTIKEVNVWDSIYSSATDASVKEHARLRLASLWSQVYKTAPTIAIKKRAIEQLNKIGFEPPE